jgi:hypothetical protein
MGEVEGSAAAASFLTNDESGNRNDGTVNGAKLTTDRFGSPSSAFSFEAYPQFIDTTGSTGFPAGTSHFTVSLWARVALLPADAQILLCNGVVNDFSLVIYRTTTGTTAPLQWMMGGDYNLDLGTPDVAWEPSRWYNILLVRGGNSMKIYRDGVVLGESTVTSGISAPPGSRNLRFGLGVPPQLHQFYGKLDDIRIYNRGLTPSEVSQLYTYESQPHPCIPHAATAQVVNGFVVGATITDAGCGYTEAPTVLIRDGGGSGATATATLSNGRVVALNMTSAGIGYTGIPTIRIASPPFMPWVEIQVSKVQVTQHVVLGRKYVLESSPDVVTWSQVGAPFTAEDEVIVQELGVADTGRYFRLRQIP